MRQPPGALTPFTLAIDIEPDGQATGRRAAIELEGLARLVVWLDELRARLADATDHPVRLAWFIRMDDEITERGGAADAIAIAAERHLSRLADLGDAIGLHTHLARWDDGRGSWLVDHGNPGFVEDAIARAFEAFERTFGRRCTVHRFGDRWSSPAAIDALDRLGVRVDLTVEPGQRGVRRMDETRPATGRIPDYGAERSEPRRIGTSLWSLPLSSADPGPALPPARRMARRLRYLGQARHRTLLLDRAWPSPAVFWSVTEAMLGAQARPYVAVAIRSDLALTSRMAGVRAIFDHHLASASRIPFVFEGPEATLADLGVATAREEPDEAGEVGEVGEPEPGGRLVPVRRGGGIAAR